MQGDWVSSKSPAFIGGTIGILISLALLGTGVNAFLDGHRPLPFIAALIGAGIVELACCVYAMQRVRIAWAFALSLNGTGFLVFLFGAPKVRDAFDTILIVGFIPCFAFLTVTALLAASGHEYGN